MMQRCTCIALYYSYSYSLLQDRKEPELELLENLFKQKDADEWIRDISEIFDDLIDVRYNRNDNNLSSLVCIRRLQQFFMDMKEKGY